MRASPVLYLLAQSFFRMLFPLCFAWKVEGATKLPAKGPVILCANHRHNWDPPVVGSASRRMVYFMAKEELFHSFLSRTVMELVGAFRVRRGHADRNALRAATALLRAGAVVGIFPEGSRSKDGSLGEGAGGAAILALKTGARVVPVAVSGHYDRRGLTVRFGDPVAFEAVAHPDKDCVARATQSIMEAIRRLVRAEETTNATAD